MSVKVASLPPPVIGQSRVDRYVYVFMAGLFLLVAAVGFAPRSVAILSGELPNPSPLVHVHAALMASWLLLFLAQSSLIASDRRRLHQRLGMLSFAIAPAMFLVMSALTITLFQGFVAFASDPANNVPPDVSGDVAAFFFFVLARAAVLFGVFYTWAALARRTAPEMHKRMIVMASIVVIDAAVARMGWLHGYDLNGGTGGYLTVHVYQFFLLTPVIVYDLMRFGRVHRAYVIGVGLFLPFAIATTVLPSTSWWQRVASVLVGAGG